MRHWDSGQKNYYIVANPDTGRWQVLSWDLDGIFNAGSDSKGDFVFPTTDGEPALGLAVRRCRTSGPCTTAGSARWPTSSPHRHPASSTGSTRSPAPTRTTSPSTAGLGRAVADDRPEPDRPRPSRSAADPDRRPHQRHRDPDIADRRPRLWSSSTRSSYQPGTREPSTSRCTTPRTPPIDITGWTSPGDRGLHGPRPAPSSSAHGYAVWTDDDAELVAELTRAVTFLMARAVSAAALSGSGEAVEPLRRHPARRLGDLCSGRSVADRTQRGRALARARRPARDNALAVQLGGELGDRTGRRERRTRSPPSAVGAGGGAATTSISSARAWRYLRRHGPSARLARRPLRRLGVADRSRRSFGCLAGQDDGPSGVSGVAWRTTSGRRSTVPAGPARHRR